jgi:hypothetical protein
MKFPTGSPILNFSYYFAYLSAEQALARVVTALLDLGAVLKSGRGTLWPLNTEEHIASAADLRRWLVDPPGRLEAVVLTGATDTRRNHAEVVTFALISDAVAHTDRPAIEIETDGHWTEYWLYIRGRQQARTLRQQARTIGKRAKKRFCTLVEAVQPSYAAILFETYLPCPAELRQRPHSRYDGFSSFFVSSSYVGAARLARIQTLFDGAYIEPVGDGLYISAWEFFNPEAVSLACDEGRRSEQVAHLIATIR